MTRERLTAAARRETILDAAADAFGRMGYEATRMDDVAKGAGIAKGLLYKHFRSKDALFEALLDRQGAAYTEELRQALAEVDLTHEPEEGLRRGMELWIRQVAAGPSEFNFADPGTHDAYDALRERIQGVIGEALLRAEPGANDVYGRLVAAGVQGAAEAIGMAWRDRPDEVSEDQAVAVLTLFTWGGLSLLRETLTNPAAGDDAGPATG
jgi:AcrR family transcriptional regulator